MHQVGVGLAAPALVVDAAWSATPDAQTEDVIAVKAATTDITSDSERMISYRHQQHMVQTSDGALHLLVNRGTIAPGPGLSLFSSYDAGLTWQFMANFPSTDDNSTGDALLFGNVMWMVFHTSAGVIMFSQLQYDNVQRTWTTLTLEQAYMNKQYQGQNAALAVDDLGAVWVGFTESKTTGGNLRVVVRSPAGTWSDPGLIFGPTDKPAVERSARPVYIAGGMGMVFTVHTATYWATRTNSAPYNAVWTQALIYPGAPGKAISDPYASHFNVTTDPTGGLHMITVEAYDVLYFKHDATTDLWNGPVQVDDSRKVAYAQIGIINGKLAVAFSVQRFAGTVVLSPDLGVTWAEYASLNLVPLQPGINYNTARVEFPASGVGPMQIVQQYAINTTQKLMMFNVPAP